MADDGNDQLEDKDATYLKAVLASLDATGENGGAPLLYDLEETSLALHGDRPLRLGPPFGDHSSRTSWQLVRQVALRNSPAAHRPHLLVRASLDSQRGLFVDVAAASLLSIVGARRDSAALAGQMALDASSGRYSPPALVVKVAFAPRAGAHEAGTVVSIEEMAGLARSELTVLAIACGMDHADLGLLLGAVNGAANVGIVADRPHEEARLLLTLDSEATSTPFFRPVALAGAPSSEEPRYSGASRDQPPVEVLVLGAVEVHGGDHPLSRRPKLTELIAYFAMHPHGSASRAWTSALWPDRRVPQQTVANRLSEARRLLGFAPDDLPRLRRDGERHLLADVRTDWQRFVQLSGGDAAPQSLRAALELVRGRPFEDLHEGQWTVFEGFVAEMEQRIAKTALAFGEQALEHGDADTAAWAAQQALRAAPYDERLHRLLMRAADKAGNRVVIEGVLRNLALMLEIDGDPLEEVHPETAALYQQLSGRNRTALLG